MKTLIIFVMLALFAGTLSPANSQQISGLPVTPTCVSTITLAKQSAPASDKRWWVSVGAFLPSNDVGGVSSDTGYSVAMGTVIRNNETGCIQGSLRYSRYDLNGGDAIELTSPKLEYLLHCCGDKVYAGLGAGVVFGKNTDGGHTFSFSYDLIVGMNFSSTFIEARWERGTKIGEHGIVLSGGLRF